MRRKLVLFFLIIAVFGAAAYAVDHFLFSFATCLNPLEGKFQSITTKGNQGAFRLNNRYDLERISSQLLADSSYRATLHRNSILEVTRKFGAVTYVIRFENGVSGGKNFTDASFSTRGDLRNEPKDPPNGEPCYKPARSIYLNVYEIIDDMPLNDDQRADLKEQVRVYSPIQLRGF